MIIFKEAGLAEFVRITIPLAFLANFTMPKFRFTNMRMCNLSVWACG